VTDREAVVVFPAASVARAVRVCVPAGTPDVAHDHDHDAVPDARVQDPLSTRTSTLLTDALSAAVPDTETVPATAAPAPGDAKVTVGAVVSATTLATVTRAVAVAALPLLSTARATMVWVPLPTAGVDHAQLQVPSPDAGAHAPPSTESETAETAVLSLLVPVTDTVPDTEAPAEGAVMDTVGAVVSAHFGPRHFPAASAWPPGSGRPTETEAATSSAERASRRRGMGGPFLDPVKGGTKINQCDVRLRKCPMGLVRDQEEPSEGRSSPPPQVS
jgi:hypothetical protein